MHAFVWACLCVFILKAVKLKFSKTANSQYLSIVGCISRAGGAALIRRGLGNGIKHEVGAKVIVMIINAL